MPTVQINDSLHSHEPVFVISYLNEQSNLCHATLIERDNDVKTYHTKNGTFVHLSPVTRFISTLKRTKCTQIKIKEIKI